MKKYKKIITLANAVEASLLTAILDEEQIPYYLRSYHDTAYDGLWQTQLGWGHLEAAVEYEKTILSIYEDIKKKNEPS